MFPWATPDKLWKLSTKMFKPILQVAITILALLCSALAQPESVKKAHATTHSIEMATIIEHAGCSATAVGHHALLTDTHCELGTDTVTIDGQEAQITGRIRDGLDHTILLVDAEFEQYAEISDRELEQGDSVFIFGNPGNLSDIMRYGIFSGIKQPTLRDVFTGAPLVQMLLFDLNDYHGDSGAAIFDAISGKITSTVTGTYYVNNDDGTRFSLAFAFPLHFTKDQLKQIQ